MIPYIALIAIPMIFQYVNLKRTPEGITPRQQRTETSMALFWMLLFFMLILRHETIGGDIGTYKIIFTQILNSNLHDAIWRSNEIGWNIMNKIVATFSDNFRIILVISAFLGTWHIAKAYINYSKDMLLSVSIYINVSCFVMLFSGLRQSISMSLGFVAFEYVKKKKFILFLLIVALAMSFHTSAFMLLFMYPLYHIRVKRRQLIFVVPVLIVALIFNEPIFTFLGDVLSFFTDYDATIIETGAYTMLILFAIMAIFSFVIPDESKLDADTLGMRSFLLFAVALQIFAPLHTLAMRMNYYYIVFIPLAMSRIIDCHSKSWSKVAMVARHVMVIFFLVYFFVNAPKDNALDTFPYRFFWEDVFKLK